MTVLTLDGFDKYGGLSSNGLAVGAALASGDWTTAATFTNSAIVAGLSSTGFALQVGNAAALSKTLAANYSRLIGGLRFSCALGGTPIVMQFRDGATAQCSLTLESTGIINLRTGAVGGAILAGAAAVASSSVHYLEWDITFAATGPYQVWIDGVSAFSGTGNTRGGTANNYSNAIGITGGTAALNVDDLYLFDSTGTRNNAVLLTSPRVETTFPASDSAVQYASGAAILGSSVSRSTGTNTPTGGSLTLRPYRPAINCTINSIGITPFVTNGTANYRGVIYGDTAGAAGTLLSSGTTVTGTTANTAMTLPLTTPQALTSGTQYWLGFMNDTGVNLQLVDSGTATYRASATFASGAPGTAPAMTGGQLNYLFWGNLTATGNNWYSVSNAAGGPQGLNSYVFDATVTHEDLYNFGALSTLPANVYVVALKGSIAKSDAGAKTISLRTKSSSTDSAGSLAGQTPATTFGWMSSMFETDPNTSAAWSAIALNAATSGVRVDS
jgi:hypothetical protein